MAENKKRERITVIIDGFNLFIRNFMAIDALNSVGEPIGGVIGFINSINGIVQRFAPEEVFVVWESGGPSPKRKHIYKEYKANRAKVKDIKVQQANDLRGVMKHDHNLKVTQLTMLSQLLKQTPICQIFVSETECDDIIGYLIKGLFFDEENKKIIVSNDKDFYQLLDDPKVSIYDPATKTIIDGNGVLEKYGIAPQNFCLAKTIAGDLSDNIEGVRGAGFKTISKRFTGLLDALNDVSIDDLLVECRNKIAVTKKPPKVYQDIIDNEKLIRRNWSLMYLDSTSTLSAQQIEKVKYTVETFEPKMNRLEFLKLFMKFGINNRINIDQISVNFQRYLV